MKIFISLFIFCSTITAKAGVQHHILLKNDFNNDGIADRVVYASNGISGFYQSTSGNRKIDTFYLKQKNRSIFFTSLQKNGGPYLKLREDAGLFSVISLWKYENSKFKLKTSYVLPSKTYFSDDPFACPDNQDPFGANVTKPALSFSEAIKKYSVADAIKKAIAPECKDVFGADYPRLESQIISACSINDGKSEKNGLVSCLDKDELTRMISGKFKTKLAETIFEEGFKISCSKSNKNVPLASFESSSKGISFYQVSPAIKDRNFKADFFHEALHGSDLESENEVKKIVDVCLNEKEDLSKSRVFTTDTGFQQELESRKDGVEIALPQKEVSATAVPQAMASAEKALDRDFSMGNDTQFRSLSTVSRVAFKSFEPMMAAAYNAALPVAFAGNMVKTETGAVASAVAVAKNNREYAAVSSARLPASEPVGNYLMPSLPETQDSARGELGNGVAMKSLPTAVAANPEVNSTTAGGSTSLAQQRSAYEARRAAAQSGLAANVPKLQAENDFIESLTRGKYAEVRAKLNDPSMAKILEERQIQYLDRNKVVGSKRPVIVVKDLGNGFSIRRILVE